MALERESCHGLSKKRFLETRPMLDTVAERVAKVVSAGGAASTDRGGIELRPVAVGVHSNAPGLPKIVRATPTHLRKTEVGVRCAY
jgi:hypothetical protein